MTNAGSIAVIGGGLFGSAVARHLSEAGRQVTVVASPEPPEPAAAQPGRPMASHYDQGRIVRMGGSDQYQAELARASISRYPQLARRSGIGFFARRPLVVLSADPAADVAWSQAVGADVSPIDLEQLRSSTGIAAPAGFDGGAVIEADTAGIVNPRLLVRAQLELARVAGATVVDSPAIAVDADQAPLLVTTANGRRIKADRLVLATGPYGTSLIGLDQPIQRRLRTIALIEVDGPGGGGDGPGHELPSLSAREFLHPSPVDPKLEEAYWVPPVPYPDGGTYLKIGGNSLPMITATDNDDIGSWFRSGGSAEEAAALFGLACDLLPEHRLRLADHKPCVVSYTGDQQPIIERISDRIVLALAGNGSGATTGDEVGRRAAALALTGD